MRAPSSVFEFELGPSVEAWARGSSFLLTTECANATARAEICLGTLRNVQRWLALFRYEPFWLKPLVGTHIADVPVGTEWLLCEHTDGSVTLIAPLPSAPFYCTLLGRGEQLAATVDSGDPDVTGTRAELALIARGDNAFELIRNAAQDVATCLGLSKLRRASQAPDFWQHLGWCTWDAFGKEVSQEKLYAGLASFQSSGLVPRWLILDDGWQDTVPGPFGTSSLHGFESNHKFEAGLAHTVGTVKQTYGVQHFMLWHAIHGAWGGVDEGAFAAYQAHSIPREYAPEVLANFPDANRGWVGEGAVVPAREHLRDFLFDYHARLATLGVDGVKVDNQASLDALSRGQGGRIAYARAAKQALEASVRQHFAGRLISSMAGTSSLLYTSAAGSAVRSSIDFWPHIDDSHGFHGYVNALVSLWFGEFFWPDWDVFISGHAYGGFHAALRAVSGSAVYVADAPQQHDVTLLRSLLSADGRTLRAQQPARPTRDCLFVDVLGEHRLLKLWNENSHSAVLGVFHCQHASRQGAITDAFSVSDVPSATQDDYAVYLQRQDRLFATQREDRHELTLAPLDWEIVTLVPLRAGFAVLGLREKLNSGASIDEIHSSPHSVRIAVSDGGELICYSERAPREIRVDTALNQTWRWAAGRLSIALEPSRAHWVEVIW